MEPVMNQPIPQIIIPLLITVPLIVFWVWMFQDMMSNANLPNEIKNNWTIAFLFANVFAASYYYATEIERIESPQNVAKRRTVRRNLIALLTVDLFVVVVTIIRYLHQ